MRLSNTRAALAILFSLCCLPQLLAIPSRDLSGEFRKEFESHRLKDSRPKAKFDADIWFNRRNEMKLDAERLRQTYFECLKNLKAPAEEVTVPVESYDDGSVKASAFAMRAEFFQDEGLVWAEDVAVSYFSPEGEEIARLDSKNCIVDRKTKSIWSEGFTRVTHGGTTVSGNGVYFSLAEEYIILSSNAEISSTDLKLGGLKL